MSLKLKKKTIANQQKICDCYYQSKDDKDEYEYEVRAQ